MAWKKLSDLIPPEPATTYPKHGLTVVERVMRRVRVDQQSGCWRYTGEHGSGGYGSISVMSKPRLREGVHRVIYRHAAGPIPDGWDVDHVKSRGCVHRDCVNPAHLEAVTQVENQRRTRLAECFRGHALTDDNTFPHPNGGRCCRECSRINRRIYVARQKAKALTSQEAN